VVALTAGCGEAAQSQAASAGSQAVAASPDAIIASWGDAACGGAPVTVADVEGSPDGVFSSDVIAAASCDLPINGTRAEKGVYIEVYASEAAVRSKLATVDCSANFIRVIGPTWYSVMRARSAATALQEQLGASLAC